MCPDSLWQGGRCPAGSARLVHSCTRLPRHLLLGPRSEQCQECFCPAGGTGLGVCVLLVRGGSHGPRTLAETLARGHCHVPWKKSEAQGGTATFPSEWRARWVPGPLCPSPSSWSEKHFVSSPVLCWSRAGPVSPPEVPGQALVPPCPCLGPGDLVDLHVGIQRLCGPSWPAGESSQSEIKAQLPWGPSVASLDRAEVRLTAHQGMAGRGSPSPVVQPQIVSATLNRLGQASS